MLPTPRKICLIEDDALMGESLADRFELEGLAFDWHRTGATALTALRQHDYALVISDIRLPDLSGDALFEQLLAQQHSLPPFIFITEPSWVLTQLVCNARAFTLGFRHFPQARRAVSCHTAMVGLR